ncbi:DUF4830 domain-containing protein [Bacillus ndiopicus]|uniref:DUF4830 domain-containing protein n=1 Tax=Bacillus ndiopicus TaxID=1347368 RepID=UPI0005A88C33|nr:DUF4830 domain-containing protein [Bacillus ndiopicus]
MKKYAVIVILFFLIACEESYDQQHKEYLANMGWHIKKQEREKTYTLQTPEEMLAHYDVDGLTFLRDYQGKEVTQFLYTLKEQDAEHNNVKAVILENEGDIIGGYGLLPSWDPGVFHLMEKEQLVEEKMIK